MKKLEKVASGVSRDAEILQKAIAKYIAGRGGRMLVVGAIETRVYSEYNFEIAVRCTGHIPK